MRMANKWQVLLGLGLIFWGIGWSSSQALAAEPFQGKIRKSGVESEPDWPSRVKAPDGAPNVLIWMLDDTGFAQLGSFGGLIDTPNIDALAARGLRYNNFQSTALCSPSRAALLTGRNHHAVSVGGHAAAASGFPGYWARVPRSAATMARILQQNGYGTYALGKWDHLPSEDVSTAGPFEYWPSGQGFDHFYGFLSADIDNFKPVLWSDHTPVEPFHANPQYHLSTDMADKAIEWVSNLRGASPDKPFFMYWATGAIHLPHHAPASYIEKYRGKFDMGWDKAREMILERQKRMGLVPADARLPERPAEIPAWESLSEDQKRVAARSMEAAAGQLEHADFEFGRILAALARQGELDNTIVIVTSDNGAAADGGLEGTYNEYRMFNSLPPDTKTNLKYLETWGGPGTFPGYPAGWGMAGNTPFKYFKQTVHNGGVRVPLVIAWPGAISDRGAIRNQFHHMTDLMPAVLESAGIPLPEVVDGVEQQAMDGVSLAYTFTDGNARTRKKVQYFEMFGNRAVWADGWKAVVVHNPRPWEFYRVKSFEDDIWELYDTRRDFNELDDLAEHNPNKLEELKKLFEAQAERNHVYPLRPQFMRDRNAKLEQELRKTGGVYEYHGNAHRIPERLAPPLFGRDYVITAQVDLSGNDQGVIVAMGGSMGGMALFVKDGRPAFTYNYFGDERYEIRSSAPMPVGRSELRFEFRISGDNKGVGSLFINGMEVGSTTFERVAPLQFSISETFDIGRDSGTHVTDDYATSSEFSGKIEKVVVTVALKGAGDTGGH